VPRSDGRAPGRGRLRRWFGRGRRGGGGVPRQAELELVPEGTRGRTPPPIVADVVNPLGPHMRQKAADALEGGQGHGLPALVLGILIATAHLAILDGEPAVIRQRKSMALAAQVVQDLLGALDRGFTGDDPALGPDGLGYGEGRLFLTHQLSKHPAKEVREGVNGSHGGRAGGPPLGLLPSDSTGGDQAMHMGMRGQGAGPGVQHTPDPDQPADIMGVRRERDERAACRSQHDSVEVLWRTTDELSALRRHRADHVNVGARQQLLPPCCQPGVGIQVMTRGATALAAGVVDIMFLTALLALQQLPA
jgi:hypothetical protein